MHPEAAEALVTECRRLVRRKSRGGVRGHTGWHNWDPGHCWGRVSKLGLSPMQPSTQKLGRSNICCHSETSFPVPSIQATERPRWRPEPRLNLIGLKRWLSQIHGNDLHKSKELVEKNTDLAPPRKSWVLPIRSWSQIASSKLLSITWRHHRHPHISTNVRHQAFLNNITSNCIWPPPCWGPPRRWSAPSAEKSFADKFPSFAFLGMAPLVEGSWDNYD